MSKKYMPEQLEGFTSSSVSIECSKCKQDDIVENIDDYEAFDLFFEDGWRATDKMCYCPSCAKKYLKSSQTSSK